MISSTHFDFFRASIQFSCDSLDPVFGYKHALRTSKASESSVARIVSKANVPSDPHMWDLIDIIRVKHCNLKNSLGKIQRVSTIVVDFKVIRQYFPTISKPNL